MGEEEVPRGTFYLGLEGTMTEVGAERKDTAGLGAPHSPSPGPTQGSSRSSDPSWETLRQEVSLLGQ